MARLRFIILGKGEMIFIFIFWLYDRFLRYINLFLRRVCTVKGKNIEVIKNVVSIRRRVFYILEVDLCLWFWFLFEFFFCSFFNI